MSKASNERFTPGPWVAEKPIGSNGYWDVNSVCTHNEICACLTEPDTEANAMLIAQAPEMYALLSEIYRSPMKDAIDWVNFKGRVNKVLKKARGEV